MTQNVKPPAQSSTRVVPLKDRILRGKKEAPLRLCVYGVPGVGKSTFASRSPSPLFLCAEEGAEQIDVAKLPRPDSWEESLGIVRQLSVEPHDYKTFVIDTLDALEALAIAYVCGRGGKETLADFDWGKGPQALCEQWRILFKGLESLRNGRGMNVILLAHAHVKATNDPQLGRYDRYTPKLDERSWNFTNEWCDFVGFAQFETAVYEKKGERTRGIVTGARVLRTVRGTGYEAKNRFSLPPTLPLDWDTFQRAVTAHSVAPETVLRDQLAALLAELGDAEIEARAKAYLAKYGDNGQTMAEAINFVRTIRDERAAPEQQTTAKGE